ncbi:MAG: hypothetical protein ABJF10_02800 [Chthoniobacter sp.]|uniref:hypothetical protein n=1 Tax=Chthoniobacter sp. TaxID=2510640 RepID=UPI0032A5F803
MQYYLPVLWLAEELPPQAGPEDKLGGRPWGLSAETWPKCRECGRSQSLLAQFVHHAARLNLGRDGRILSVFQCNHDPGMCSTWEGGSGANACFVTEPEDLLNALSHLPADAPPLDREVRISEWLEREDQISEADAAHFFSESAYFTLPSAVKEMAADLTKLGSVPQWVQSPDETPRDGWKFVGQLDDRYSFFREPGDQVAGAIEDPHRHHGRSHCCEGPNFGSRGIAYLFLRKGAGVPEGWFFWQCG